MRRSRILPAIVLALLPSLVQAHGVHGSMGWLHPLTGLDHLIAMVAVGAWSAMLGGIAVWLVPAFFVIFMFLGSLAGLNLIEIPFTEPMIALSVILLGVAIATRSVIATPVAALGTAIFGFVHGYAHGYEVPVLEEARAFIAGFLVSTAFLHIAGLIVAAVLMRQEKGEVVLRIAGAVSAAVGLYLLYIIVK